MRNLTKTLAVVSLLIPASAYSLGIGEIKLHSALNQNLDADILLSLSHGEALNDLKVNIAPADKFDAAGVPWSYFLSKLKFEPVMVGSSPMIRVTSREALKEPFLDFLLEVSWPTGHIYREFTVLVDPPELYQQPTVPFMSARADSRDYEAAPEYTPPAPPKPKVVRRPRVPAVSTDGATVYGPTTKNDTLWRIAEQASKDQDVSIEQMLIALYEENPHAFYKANINALLAGKKLRLPNRDTVLKLSRNQAIAEFNRQIQAWKRHEAPDVVFEDGGEAVDSKQLTLVAPAQESVSEHASVTAGRAQPTAIESAAEAQPEQKPGTAAVDNAIQQRVAALEKQLATMQELIALKDQQLAALQNQAQEKTTGPAPKAGQAIPVEPQMPTPSETAQPKPAITTPSQQVETKTAIAPPGEPGVTQPPAMRPIEKPVAAPGQVKPQPAIKRPPPKMVAPPPEEPVDWYYLAIGGAGAGLLLALGGLWWRQRQLKQTAATVSPYATPARAGAARPADTLSEPTDDSYGLDLTGSDNIFASDFAAGDFDVIDMDQGEIDPISEADVYLAYGRYQQAEDLMRDAIAEQPERDECKLKLLEIFYANANRAAFERYAAELIEAGKKDDLVFWSKVVEMASEMCADSPLFSFDMHHVALKKATGGGIAADMPTAIGGGTSSLIDDSDFDLASFEQLLSGDSGQSMFADKADLFDADSLSFGDKPQAATDDASKPKAENIDFDLSLFAVDTPISELDNRPPPSDAKAGLPFDFSKPEEKIDLSDDFNLIVTEPPAATEKALGLDFSLDKAAAPDNRTQHEDIASFFAKNLEQPLDFDKSYQLDFEPRTDIDSTDRQDTHDAFSDSTSNELLDFDKNYQLDFSAEQQGASDALDADGKKADDLFSSLKFEEPLGVDESYHSIDFSSDKTEGFDEPVRDNAGSLMFDDSAQQQTGAFDEDYRALEFVSDKTKPADDYPANLIEDFDFSIPEGTREQDDKSFGIADLSEMDEMETKLDLAIAYIDMGDNEAAKEIAQEVLEKGSPEQQMIAKALLDGGL